MYYELLAVGCTYLSKFTYMNIFCDDEAGTKVFAYNGGPTVCTVYKIHQMCIGPIGFDFWQNHIVP